jgi:hypothetical protein
MPRQYANDSREFFIAQMQRTRQWGRYQKSEWGTNAVPLTKGIIICHDVNGIELNRYPFRSREERLKELERINKNETGVHYITLKFN